MPRNPKIRFSFGGQNYEVGMEAYEKSVIQLPDGRVLEVGMWLESMPPKPSLLKVRTNFSSIENAPLATKV